MTRKSLLFLCFNVILAILLNLLGICVPAQGTKKQRIIPPFPDGYTLFDGDLILPTSFVQSIMKANRPLDAEAVFNTNLWTNGVVRFQFQTTGAAASNCPNAPMSGAVSAANQTAMLNQMAAIEAVANVDFQQCANNNCGNIGNFIFIRDSTNDIIRDANNNCVNGATNSSQVGMVGGSQTFNLVNWNTLGSEFIPAHELLHALGFYHEQNRADRDTYVTILCFNVQGLCQGSIYNQNFTVEGAATMYGAYDFDSLMHYGQCAFSTNPNCPGPDFSQTIQVKEPYRAQWQNAIGQRTRLSALDRATLSFLYPQPNARFVDCFYGGGSGPPNGTFRQPWITLAAALASTPPGGTIWVLNNCSFPAGTYNNNVTIRTAPNVVATFGS